MRRHPPTARLVSALLPGATLVLVLALAGCGDGEPPETLAGFRPGLTQGEVLATARERGGFNCRLRATRPTLARCEGPAEEGTVGLLVRDDALVRITLRLEPSANEDPRRTVRRFVDPFGDPAWRDRPFPPRASPPERYHTLWLDDDSTRALALLCVGQELRPPCTAELTRTSPAGVRATLDSLLAVPR